MLCVLVLAAGIFVYKDGQKIKNKKSLTDVPPQAMEFIQVYSSIMADEDFYNVDNCHLGFGYLLYNDMIPKEYNYYNTNDVHESYRMSYDTQMDIYQFMIADSMPENWWENRGTGKYAIDYQIYDTNLVLKEFISDGENTFCATFSKTQNGIPLL